MTSNRLLTRRKSSRNLVILVIMQFVLANNVESKDDKRMVDYCDKDMLPNVVVTNHLQFKKEFVMKEYAIARTFKSLHCCAKGYRSIEWWVWITLKYSVLKLDMHLDIRTSSRNFSEDKIYKYNFPGILLKNWRSWWKILPRKLFGLKSLARVMWMF